MIKIILTDNISWYRKTEIEFYPRFSVSILKDEASECLKFFLEDA